MADSLLPWDHLLILSLRRRKRTGVAQDLTCAQGASHGSTGGGDARPLPALPGSSSSQVQLPFTRRIFGTAILWINAISKKIFKRKNKAEMLCFQKPDL